VTRSASPLAAPPRAPVGVHPLGPLAGAEICLIAGIQNGMPHSMGTVLAAVRGELERRGARYRILPCRLPGARRGSLTSRVWSLGVMRYVVYPLRAALDRAPGPRLVLDHANAHVGWLGGRGPRVVVVYDTLSLIPPRRLGFRVGLVGYLRFALSRLCKAPALRQANVVVAPSEATRRSLVAIAGVDPARVRVARPGVDRSIFRPGDRAAAGRALGLEPGIPVVLNVAGREARKNEAVLLASVARLRRRLPVRLVCVGRAPAAASRRLVALHGLDGAVMYAGEVGVEDLVRHYQAADVLAHPTLAEGSSLVALEAMAAGCPVVTSRLPALGEVCGGAALAVAPEDPDELAEALHSVLRDPGRRRALVEAGRAVAARASWASFADVVLEACADAAARAGESG
jgi:D-inositol-3-phosphate glycosyltransferase